MKYKALIILLFVSLSSTAQKETLLKTFTKNELLTDYDLTVSSLKEAHPGLYWYTSFSEYEKIFTDNRNKIKDGMNSYEFYRILSEILSADKEGHSRVNRSSKDIGNYIKTKGKYLPFAVKTINKKVYLRNNIDTLKTIGKIITKINDTSIDSILTKIFKNTSRLSDGFSTTGKYKLLDRFNFAGYYLDVISNFKKDKVSIELVSPVNNTTERHIINLADRDNFVKIARNTPRKNLKNSKKLYHLEIKKKTAILTFNDFDYRRYERQNSKFTSVIDSLFRIIKSHKTKNLIIDIRNNSGGSEGAEDYLFSYLTTKPYKKYKYVESNGFSYSFLNHTDYKNNPEHLKEMLVDEHELKSDGRFLRKENVLPTKFPQKKPFKGQVYILISGKTYSGGSEFAGIAKSNSNAIFIGEETGGGFYGQTSGFYVYLLLPNSKIEIKIPLLKFATTFKSKDIPLGRGIIPHFKISQTFNDFINEIDTEMEFTLKMIENKH